MSPSPPRTVVITGLPGTGKTTLALALASRHPSTYVLHTDLLKQTLRHGGDPRLKGPSWGAPQEQLRAVAPVLAAHAAKAQRDGYRLVVEGTLAAALVGPTIDWWCLVLPASARQLRIQRKHPSARQALVGADLRALAQAIAHHQPPTGQRLPADRQVADLVHQLSQRFEAPFPGGAPLAHPSG